MVKLFNTKKLIRNDPNVFKFMQANKNEEYQAVSLEKEYKIVLLFPHTRYTKNNKQQENNYTVDSKLGKGVYAICRIQCSYTDFTCWH